MYATEDIFVLEKKVSFYTSWESFKVGKHRKKETPDNDELTIEDYWDNF